MSLYFESWTDFVQYLSDADVVAPESKCSSLREESQEGWIGTRTWEEALTMARDGWPEMAADIESLSSPIVEAVTSLIDKLEIRYDVEGMAVDIPLYLDGDPDCWMRYETTTSPCVGVKHLRIVFNCMISCAISTEVIQAKGAGIAALVQALEYAGNRCEVVVCVSYGGKDGFECYVKIKNADQDIDMPRLAFALAHNSMPRRLMFHVLECQRNWEALEVGGGYGGDDRHRWTVEASDKGDFYFGHSHRDEPQWTSPAATRAWIFDQLKQQGVTFINEELIKQ